MYDLIYFRYAEQFSLPAQERTRQIIVREVKSADVVICISATTKGDLEDRFGIDPNKVFVVHPAGDPIFRQLHTEELHTEELATGELATGELATGGMANDFRLPTTKPFWLYVGQRERYKNFAMLLEAHALRRTHSDAEMIVVGPPWTEAERQALAAKKVQESVHLLTNITDAQLNLLYNQALAFVYPSHYEGFGIPLLEAMACGCAIVASSIPSTQEIAVDVPYYFESTQIDSLLAALGAAEQQGRDPARVARGLQVAADYTWQKTARGVLRCYYRAAQLPQPDFLATHSGH